MTSTSLGKTVERIRQAIEWRKFPESARRILAAERSRKLGPDPGIQTAVEETLGWLCRAQDHSLTADGGVARHYSLIDGWGPSYPETTGYIVPTFLDLGKRWNDDEVIARGRRMLDWLVSLQLSSGAFQGGTVTDRPIAPVTFNTGQILIGLAAGAAEFGDDYAGAMHAAAGWLASIQDEDGCWREAESPFALSGDKTYDTHTAWGLLEAAKTSGDEAYAEAALRNIRWAMSKQHHNGWFRHCCLTDPNAPLTHTLGYTLRGLIEGYRFSGDDEIFEAARLTGESLLNVMAPQGFIPGRLDSSWASKAEWACLTGNAQIAHCWLQLYQDTGHTPFLEAGRASNSYVRRTLDLTDPPEIRGGIRGSYPLFGPYGQYQYLNWGAKFFIDSNILEQEVVAKLEKRIDTPMDMGSAH